MKYEKGDIVRVVSTHGYSGIKKDQSFVGAIGEVVSGHGKVLFVLFDSNRDENISIFEHYSIYRKEPVKLYFGEDELELYIQDINFLD